MNKVIATDCDGVLLDWLGMFKLWMRDKGYDVISPEGEHDYYLHTRYGITHREIRDLIVEFNQSAYIGFLDPHKDAAEYVPDLHKGGCTFLVITSLGTNEYAKELRRMNLERVFGPVFEEIICLDYHADKESVLRTLRDKYGKIDYWLEDHVRNARAGVNLGISGSVLFDAPYNKDASWDLEWRHRVDDWKGLHDLIE